MKTLLPWQTYLEGERANYGIINRFAKKNYLGRREAEEKMRRLLCWLHGATGIRFVAQRPFFVARGISFIADFYIPKFKIVIEIDGLHHNSPQQKEKDGWRSRVLSDVCGATVVRFANSEMDEDAACKKKLIGALLSSPKRNSYYTRVLGRVRV